LQVKIISLIKSRIIISAMGLILAAGLARAQVVGYDFLPSSNGPAAGGNILLITNCNSDIGSGHITNAVFYNYDQMTGTTNILGQGLRWVRLIVPAHTAGAVNIEVQDSISGVTNLAYPSYTYNPAGQIGDWVPGPCGWTNLGAGMLDEDSSIVYALALGTNGELYAGGIFTNAGGVTASNVAKWNGTAWTNLGDGVAGTALPAVRALALGTNGELYAGGTFASADGIAATNIAKWTGTAWTNLGSGMGDTVRALALGTNGELYAAGEFTNAGEVALNYVAKWTGTAWTNLGSGMDNTVRALALGTNGELYAGGYFTSAGGVDASCVAKWTGTAWTNIGPDTFCGSVFALAPGTNRELYAGGSVTIAGVGEASATNIVKWTGTAWTNLGAGIDDTVYSLALGTNNELYAGGYFTSAGEVAATNIAKWTGTAWTTLNSAMDDTVYALAYRTNGDLYAAGCFTTVGGMSASHIAKWGPTLILGSGGVTPVSGSCAGGYQVTISGANLGSDNDITNVSLCNVSAAIVSQSGTQIVVTAGAAGSAGIGAVRVYSASRGETVKSNAFTYTGVDQTITFGAIADQSVTNRLTLSATASSGLPVIFTVGSGPASINSNVATFNATGMVSIVASQPGDTNWNPAPNVTQAFNVVSGVMPTPAGVAATEGTYTNHIRITWQGVPGATGYYIYRNTANNSATATLIASISATQDTGGQLAALNLESSVYYYDDYTINPINAYYYWVQAKSGSAISSLSYVGVGYAMLGPSDASGTADIAVSDFIFLPVNITNASNPGTASCWVQNYGPDNLSTSSVRFDFYMTNGVWIGGVEQTLTLGAGAEQLVIFKSTEKQGISIRGDLSGVYRPEIKIRHLARLYDPNMANNTGSAAGPVTVKAWGVNSPGRSLNDYDGDGKADGCLYQSTLGRWYAELSGMRYSAAVDIGDVGMWWTPVSGDYDGDGLSDVAAYDRFSGQWLIRFSSSGQVVACLFGGPDFTTVTGDIDGDAKTDPAVYREADGYWVGAASSRGYISCHTSLGETGYQPVMADYDGDGLADPAVYDRESGLWVIGLSSVGYQLLAGIFGGSGYLPVSADYDGDGLADPAVYAPDTAYWHVLMSGSLATQGTHTYWRGPAGNINGLPVPADYDGDGKADLAVYLPATPATLSRSDCGQAVPSAQPMQAGHQDIGIWELFLSTQGYQLCRGIFGGPEYQPVTE